MTGKDGLEEFIGRNREAFDDKEAPESVWNRISQNLNLTENRGWWNNLALWKAAAVIFMAASVYFALSGQSTPQHNPDELALNEFKDVEAFYISEISQKVELIESISGGEGAEDLTHDFKQLEAMYLVLKEELRTHPSRKVKDALVLNLLVRINLLNQQLQKLEEEYVDEEKGQET